jgi:energy-coupling factor transport system ATP-binding protein
MNAAEVENVDVIFQTETGTVSAINNLSLEIEAGSWTTLIGRNGSGKSTFARALAQLLPISRGKIRIMGEVLTQRKAKRAPIQMVFQNPESGLVGETVFEDVAFGLSLLQVPAAQMRESVYQALLPFGMHGWLDKPVASLSGGQKQLLCIASCLALNPDIFIFDECTSMLDEGARQTVRQCVKKLQRSGKKTIIWLTQHLEELADADKVVALENGRIVYQGTPRAFFYADPGEQNTNQNTNQNADQENSQNKSDKNGRDYSSHDTSWCRSLGFTPPYVVRVAEHLRQMKGCSWFEPLTVTELVQGRYMKCPSN